MYYYTRMHKTSGLLLLSFSIIVSLMAGTYILMRDWNFTGEFGYISALFALLLAVLYAGSPQRSWAAVASLIVFAIYVFYRATGQLSIPLLKYILGFGMIGYGIFGLFALFRILNKQEGNHG